VESLPLKEFLNHLSTVKGLKGVITGGDLKKGLATFTLTAPGQGELGVKHGGPKIELWKYHES
jgi:hypothetical protein